MAAAQKPEFVKQGSDVLVSVLIKKDEEDTGDVSIEVAARRAAQAIRKVATQEEIAKGADSRISHLQEQKLNRAKFK